MMIKYTASYANTNRNFVIKNIKSCKKIKHNELALVYVIKNILQRSERVRASAFLTQHLGSLNDITDIDEQFHILKKYIPNWTNTIKGFEPNRQFPAIQFFENILPKYLKEYEFLTQLILPEAYIDDIIDTNIFMEQQVDFYIPQINTVIEIDGSQHYQQIQQERDLIRDKTFNKNQINVYRFTTKDVYTESEKLQSYLHKILKECKISNILDRYKEIYNRDQYTENEIKRIKYDTVMRLQCLYLSLLEYGVISFSDKIWRFNILSTDKNIDNLAQIAFEDLFIWLKSIAQLSKININKPLIEFTDKRDENAIRIDFSMIKRYTDDDNDMNTVYVRTDYYDYKNHFKVSTTDAIEYKITTTDGSEDIKYMKLILKNLFGFDEFHAGQQSIIANCLSNRDTIGILPTGSGKTLCYQYCVLLQPCISFVVSPLTTLINDQYYNATKIDGISNINYITSAMSGEDKDQVINNYKNGKYLYILISPERFQNVNFRGNLAMINQYKHFGLAIIDEVHCLSEWGHDFRTSYLVLIDAIREYCPSVSLLGLTATASRFVLEDLRTAFEITSEDILISNTMSRDELNYHVITTYENEKFDITSQLINKLNKSPTETNPGIIFTIFANANFNGAVGLCSQLSKTNSNIKMKAFTSKLEVKEKNEIQNEFNDDNISLLVATKAFGMGINKPNIRYTVHYNLPWSIESFYQESGRAGRDGNNADCYIIYTPKFDLDRIMYLWKFTNKGISTEVKIILELLKKIKHKKMSLKIKDIIHVSREKNIKINSIDLEKAIYRMKTLGYIRDWIVDYQNILNPQYIINTNNKITEDIVLHNLLSYIKKYDPEFSLESSSPRYSEYTEIYHNNYYNFEEKVSIILIKWIYDNILYERKQSIKNMEELCVNYKSSDDFKQNVENYLSYDDCEIILNVISSSPLAYKKWISFFYETDTKNIIELSRNFKQQKELTLAAVKLKRYLESYRFNTGLNYISGLLRLLQNDFNDPDGKERFIDALSQIENNLTEKFDEILSETLAIASHATSDAKNEFSEFLIERYGQKITKQVYSYLSDEYSLGELLSVYERKINKIKENFK